MNKAADEYLVLNERTEEDLAAGKYQDQRKSASVAGEPARRGTRSPATGTRLARRRPARRAPALPRPRPSWTKAQEDLALIYSARGMRPDEIAERLGVSRHTATQMILAGRSRPAGT